MTLGILILFFGCNQKESSIKTEEVKVSHPDELKSLDWMVGDWVDDDKDVDLTYTTDWDISHNFLLQHFSSQMGEGDEIQGEQIIGWDPAEKKVRSWVFDSDGGFGGSLWTQEGSNWRSIMKYTLPDGRKASAIHVYTKIDDDSYTFASTNRNIGGEIFPDIGPFKIIRKK